MFNLKNKKVIVTGATGGIGNAIVKCFINHEAKVLATGTNEEKLKSLNAKHKIFLQINLIFQIMMKLKNLSIILLKF